MKHFNFAKTTAGELKIILNMIDCKNIQFDEAKGMLSIPDDFPESEVLVRQIRETIWKYQEHMSNAFSEFFAERGWN